MQKIAGDTGLTVRRAFDLQLQQKVIPKLTGGRELEQPLTHLLHYCHTATKSAELDPQTVRDAARKALDPTEHRPGRQPWNIPAAPGSCCGCLSPRRYRFRRRA